MNHDEIKSLLEKDAAWVDSEGNSLLHHAARSGDSGLVQHCIARDVSAISYNKEGECARDVARIWGYDDIAALIDTEMKRLRAETPLPPLAYSSLQEIRDTSTAIGTNIFFDLAARGLFDQVLPLAEKDAEGLCAADFLSTGASGETVILKICQAGQISELIKMKLWIKKPSALLSVWEDVPKIYQKDIDIEAFLSQLRQTKLKSSTIRPPRKGLVP